MRRVSADKKFEQIVFEAYRQEGWVDETLMAMIQDRTYAALRRLVTRERARPIDYWGDEMQAGHYHAVTAILAAMDRWKKGAR